MRSILPPKARFAAWCALLALPGCAAVPGLSPAPVMIAPGAIAAQRSFAVATPAAAWPVTGWWRAYGDPQLDALIDEALVGSPDIMAAMARVRAAQAVAQQAGAARLPGVTVDGNAGVTKQSYNNGIPAEFLPRGWNDAGRVAGNFNFDLDLWGRNRAAFAAARSDAAAEALDAAQATLILSTDIADAYAELGRLFAQRGVDLTALDVRRQTERLVIDRVASGLDTQAERRQASAAVPAARADLAATDEQIALTRNRIAALLGAGPDRGLTIAAPAAIAAPRGLPADATTDLIGRRPDIVAARTRVEAAASRIKVARADFYPSLNLSAVVGLQSLGFGNLVKGGSSFGQAGPAFSLPIFDGGQLRGRYREARARYDEAVADYDRGVTDAYRDVADAVTSQRALGDRLDQSRQALVDSQAAYGIARQRYEGGLSTFLDVLTAQDRALQAQRIVAALQARAFTLDVALVRALGGGFAAPPVAAVADPRSKDAHRG